MVMCKFKTIAMKHYSAKAGAQALRGSYIACLTLLQDAYMDMLIMSYAYPVTTRMQYILHTIANNIQQYHVCSAVSCMTDIQEAYLPEYCNQ